MKKLVVLSFAFLIALPAFCLAAESAPVRSEKEEKALADKRKRMEEKKTELNGSKWEVTAQSADPKLKDQKDTFYFQDGMFRSEALAKRGFNPTNYTISFPSEDSELAVWETMQTGEEGMVFIRGEWEKEKMSAFVTEQLDGGKKVKEYSYKTAARTAIPLSSKEEEKSPEAGAPAPAKETSALVSGESALEDMEPIDNKEVVESFYPGTTDEITKQ